MCNNSPKYIKGQLYVMHKSEVSNDPQPVFLPLNALVEPSGQRYEFDGVKMVPVEIVTVGSLAPVAVPTPALSAGSAAASEPTTQPAAAHSAEQQQDENPTPKQEPEPEFTP
eukprot:jgi/Hompol1/5510/HPOL_004528-RA